jgi:pyridoxamine 5'-phosphate oxidase
MSDIAKIRKEYMLESLLESDVASDPIIQFGRWWEQVIACGIEEANAMTLTTVSSEGFPSARMVLLKDYDQDGFVFFTNYESHKALDLDRHPQSALVFFWKELERQVRIEGMASKISAEKSDAYFHSRPRGSQIGAWSSPQSRVIADRSVLDNARQSYEGRFAGHTVPRPAHWGGYLVRPLRMEFWQGRPDRMHDRILYTMEEPGRWRIERLAP